MPWTGRLVSGGLGRTIGAGAATLAALVVLIAGAAAGATGGILGADVANVVPGPAAHPIPEGYLSLYQQAAVTCPGLPWTVLAAIGTVESGNGTSTQPGVHSGANPAGAEVIYRWDGGLWYLRHETRWGTCLVGIRGVVGTWAGRRSQRLHRVAGS